MTFTVENNDFVCKVTPKENGAFFQIDGFVKRGADTIVAYQASSPADSILSTSGSCLPFPNAEYALENGDNSGVVKTSSGSFSFVVQRPNSFYSCQGKYLIPPQVSLVIVEKDGSKSDFFHIKLANPVNNRSLTNLPGRPVRSTGR